MNMGNSLNVNHEAEALLASLKRLPGLDVAARFELGQAAWCCGKWPTACWTPSCRHRQAMLPDRVGEAVAAIELIEAEGFEVVVVGAAVGFAEPIPRA